MGHVRVPVRLINGDRTITVNALVDTGSTIMVITRDVADSLGLRPLGKVSVELADGSGRVVDYTAVEVELMGRRAPVIAAIVEGGEVLVGVEVLERLGLAIDPVSGRLYETRRFVTRI